MRRKERVGGELPAPRVRAGPGPMICGDEGPEEGLSCRVQGLLGLTSWVPGGVLVDLSSYLISLVAQRFGYINLGTSVRAVIEV